MTNWWTLPGSMLWILGLAVDLAVLSVANYAALRHRVRLRQKLGEAGFSLPLALGTGLFCLGLMLHSQTLWVRILWGGLAAAFGVQVLWIWWRREPGEGQRCPGSVPPRVRRREMQRVEWWVWALVLGGLLAIVVLGAVIGVQISERAHSVQFHLQQLEGLARSAGRDLKPAALEEAGEHLAALDQELEAIQSRIGFLMPAGRLLRWVPRYGGDLAAASDLLSMAVGTISAGDRTFRSLTPVLDVLVGPEEDAAPALAVAQRLLPLLVAAQPELQAAKQELASVEQARSRIELSSLSPRAAGLVTRLDHYLPSFRMAVEGAMAAPYLLGADGPRTYLILAQNNQELRPTGGFISGVGELRLEGGRLASLDFSDSYAVDNHDVPHDLTPLDFQQTLFGQLWFFRDANWDADFPTSARRAMEIYARDRGVTADGVIALDLVALQLLVEALGPIQMPGADQVLTGDTVMQAIQQKWSEPAGGEGREWWLHRKDFMGQVAGAILQQLASGGTVQPADIARALQGALDEKHILVYVPHTQAALVLRQNNWDGALPSPATDLLAVVDTNVGFNKVDAKVERSIHYRVDLAAEGGPQARVTLRYRNLVRKPVGACLQEARYGDTYADMMERCYWDYVRIYVPAGSQLLAGPDLAWPPGSLIVRKGEAPPQEPIRATPGDGALAAWAAFMDLEPGAERTLTFEYRLPDWVLTEDADGLLHYRLQVHKQPGTRAVPIEVEIALPPEAEVVAGSPDDLFVSTRLRTDRDFEVVYRMKEGSP